MLKLSETDHAVQQIDDCGAMIGISRQWYEEVKMKLADYEDDEEQGRLVILQAKRKGAIRRIDELGRVAIPKAIRASLGICGGEPVEIIPAEDGVYLRKCVAEDAEREDV